MRQANWVSKRPIAPKPSTAMLSPGRAVEVYKVCNATASGSIKTASSSAMLSGSAQVNWAGSTAYSAKQPVSSTPKIRLCGQMLPRPCQHSAQWPQGKLGSMTTLCPMVKRLTPAPIFSMRPMPSWPMISGKGVFTRCPW